ncbi:sulfotransferase [Sulfitobacter sp. MF3-043]|uniref:sulfotransferase n=1 Tax=Sulfitobacter sediminivivens TaxID=3252902 RepID=UPI0036D8C55C
MVALNNYSRLDRLIHRIAFSSPGIQITAAEIEERMFQSDLKDIETGPPIFITSLPRAGTTILLTALNSVPDLAPHLYRDMPFLMAPLLWSRLSGKFGKQAYLQERAHGDGITIGFDSPEAFEEVIWKAFWPEFFKLDGIALGTAQDFKDEACTFLKRHFKKIVALRCKGQPGPGRYISKNNGNISRLGLISEIFPEADILVPMRHPLTHAASLHRQHKNFLTRHADDPFSRRYMQDIGHFEFGTLHRPILFEDFARLSDGLTPACLDYWLAYWISAFRHINQHREKLQILGYEDMCRQGNTAGINLCERLDLDISHAPDIARHFRPVPPPDATLAAYRSPLRDQAEALYRQCSET